MKIKDAFITDREQDIELQEAERTFKAYMVRDLVERDLESMSLGEIYQRASTALYNEYIENHPKDTKGYLWMGELLADQGKAAEAITQFEKALSLDPQNESAQDRIEKLNTPE